MTADTTGINPEPGVVAVERAAGEVILTLDHAVQIRLSGREGAAYLTSLISVLPHARALLGRGCP